MAKESIDSGSGGYRRLLFNLRSQLSGREALVSSFQNLRDDFPVHVREIEPDANPTLCPHIIRHKEGFGIGSDHPALFAEVRFTNQRNHSVTVMIESVVSESLFADANCEMFSRRLNGDFGK